MSVLSFEQILHWKRGERIRESGVEIHGVILEEETRPETGILVTRVKIETKKWRKNYGETDRNIRYTGSRTAWKRRGGVSAGGGEGTFDAAAETDS